MIPAFIELLNIAVKGKGRLEAPVSERQWEEVMKTAKKHAVMGLVYQAAMSLPEEQLPPRRVKIRMALILEKIAANNAAVNEQMRGIVAEFGAMGMRSCLLKGQGLSLLYPHPEYRQSGDIDLWVEGSRKDIINTVRRRWRTGEIWYHHVDVYVPGNRTPLEVHFYPTWMNSPLYNARIRKYFRGQAPVQFGNFNERLGCCTPLPGFGLVFNMVHIFRHVLMEGVGLRQLVDYYLVLMNSDEQERKEAYRQLCRLGVGHFVPSVMHVLKLLFDIPDEYMLCRPDPVKGRFLLSEIMQAGNFGRTDSRNKWRHDQNRLEKALHRYEHLSRFVMFATSEVLWSPYFKISQFVWKKLNGYR